MYAKCTQHFILEPNPYVKVSHVEDYYEILSNRQQKSPSRHRPYTAITRREDQEPTFPSKRVARPLTALSRDGTYDTGGMNSSDDQWSTASEMPSNSYHRPLSATRSKSPKREYSPQKASLNRQGGVRPWSAAGALSSVPKNTRSTSVRPASSNGAKALYQKKRGGNAVKRGRIPY